MIHAHRRDRVRASLPIDADVLLVSEPRNIRYLTGFTGTSAQVIVGADSSADVLVTDARYKQRAASECDDIGVTIMSEGASSIVDVVAGLCVAVESHYLSWQRVEQLRHELVSTSGLLVASANIVEAQRVIKDDHEVNLIGAACALTVDAFNWLCEHEVRPGVTERELALSLERRFLDLGADDIAFASIIASGPNGASPHHAPTDRPLRRGDLVTIDCGATLDGYHADFTRTIAIAAASQHQREIYTIVEQAQARGRSAVMPGHAVRDVDSACRGLIAEAGYGQAFVHPSGHGIGLAVHEDPIVSERTRGSLDAGIVLTVEPGIYLAGFGGIRIEDTVVVQDGAPKVLTDSSRELRLL